MGSVGNQNPWASYNTYKDCSQGICSIYCPQWCYIIFPPPPSFSRGGGGGGDDNDSGTDFSPLIIAVIGILASAFLLVSYYTIISKYCRPRRDREITNEMDGSGDQVGHGASQEATGGLDEMLIKSITVCKFKKGDGLFIEGKDCSVCLSEFQENESLRLLPKCNHAFHLPCIDTWLRSHASCPLCRAHVASNNILSTQSPSSRVLETTRPNSNASVLDHQHRTNDAVVVMIQESGREGVQGDVREDGVVSPRVHDDMPKTPPIRDLESLQDMREIDNGVETRQQGLIQPIRRSVSLNLSASRGHTVSIADILRVVDEDEDDCNNYPFGYGEKGRSGMLRLVRSPVAIQRSVSTGRFMFAS